MPVVLRVVDSITELGPADAGCLAVSGSHGGISSARYALAARPWLSVFNDAGVGKDAAGMAALPFLQAQGLAGKVLGDQHYLVRDVGADGGEVGLHRLPAQEVLQLQLPHRSNPYVPRHGAEDTGQDLYLRPRLLT